MKTNTKKAYDYCFDPDLGLCLSYKPINFNKTSIVLIFPVSWV